MLFRQFFDSASCTYTYLIADSNSKEAIFIDTVDVGLPLYQRVLKELDLKLAYAIDTHTHADHITGMGGLKKALDCQIAMGQKSKVTCLDLTLKEGDEIKLGKHFVKALHTPGHTSDSYCFLIEDKLLTGDTLFIRGTGRTDFQEGSASEAYDSLQRLMQLPSETKVYPGHDYKGESVSTIGEEKKFNSRLQVANKAAYIELMDNLNLPYPKRMDEVLPKNLQAGL